MDYNFQIKNCTLYINLSLKIIFVLANSVDPDEMPQTMWHFIWVFTICQSIHLGVTGKKRNKTYLFLNKNNCLFCIRALSFEFELSSTLLFIRMGAANKSDEPTQVSLHQIP